MNTLLKTQTLQKIIDLLKEKGLSQKALTDYLGLQKGAFTAWKNGTSSSYLKYIPQISEFLGVTSDSLIRDTTDDEDAQMMEYLEQLRTRPEMRMMFKLAQGATKEDVEKAVKIIEALLEK